MVGFEIIPSINACFDGLAYAPTCSVSTASVSRRSYGAAGRATFTCLSCFDFVRW